MGTLQILFSSIACSLQEGALDKYSSATTKEKASWPPHCPGLQLLPQEESDSHADIRSRTVLTIRRVCRNSVLTIGEEDEFVGEKGGLTTISKSQTT